MGKLAALALCVFLGGCGAYVAQGTVDYNEAIEDETNRLLLMNILRARDGLPTYYSDISQVRGSASASLTSSFSAPVGPLYKSTTRDALGLGGSLQVAPSFDVAPLNTAEFTQGITEPLDISILQYYISRGIPPYLLLNLLIDKIDVVTIGKDGTTIDRFYNRVCNDRTVGCTTDSPNDSREYGVNAKFLDKIKVWESYTILNSYDLMEPSGALVSGESQPAKGAAGGGQQNSAASATEILRPDGHGKYQTYTVSPRIAFCVPVAATDEDAVRQAGTGIDIGISSFQEPRPGSPAPRARFFEIVGVPHTTVTGGPAGIQEILDPAACVQRTVYLRPSDVTPSFPSTGGATSGVVGPHRFTLVYLRSVDGVVTYLGQLLRLKTDEKSGEGRPINFDISATPHPHDQITVNFDGHPYYVAARDLTPKPLKEQNLHDDRTLEVLTLLNQLLNLNKKANELPSTKAVEAVP